MLNDLMIMLGMGMGAAVIANGKLQLQLLAQHVELISLPGFPQ